MSEKQRVALISVGAAVGLTVVKLVVGLMTNSLGILSEAAHSGLDLVAAAITYWAIRISDRPADKTHAYGHGKIENLSALAETVLLLVTCAWIIFEGVHRLVSKDVEVDPNFWAFAVIIVSIVVDISRSRALSRVAKKYDSQALEADALHFSTDIWSSIVVLSGLVLVRLGKSYDLPDLLWMDSVAALGVALIVIFVGVKLARKSIRDLLDAAPVEVYREIEKAAMVPGVLAVRKLRARKGGATVFADIEIVVENTFSFERSHDIAHQAEAAVKAAVPRVDAVVHVEPVAGNPADLISAVRTLASRFDLDAHAIKPSEQAGHKTIELHLEVDRTLSVERSHEIVSRFEQELIRTLPDFAFVYSHIEPKADPRTDRCQETGDEASLPFVRSVLVDLLEELHVTCKIHHLSIRRSGSERTLSLHCGMPGNASIVDAHDLTTRIELHLREKIPNLTRVTIHVEPIRES